MEYEAPTYTFTNSKLTTSQFGGLYQVKNDRMSVYLDIIRSLAKQFKPITITSKPRNDIRHVDVLTYLATALEDNSPKQITIDNQESHSISWIKSDLSNTFLDSRVFFTHVYEHNFADKQVVTRKKRRELDANEEGNSKRVIIVHLSNIQPPVPESLQSEVDALESIDMPNMNKELWKVTSVLIPCEYPTLNTCSIRSFQRIQSFRPRYREKPRNLRIYMTPQVLLSCTETHQSLDPYIGVSLSVETSNSRRYTMDNTKIFLQVVVWPTKPQAKGIVALLEIAHSDHDGMVLIFSKT